MTERVALTPAAEELLVRLTAIHGPLMFHQSGGCCDGSAPMCYPDGDFKIGGSDVHLGDLDTRIAGAPAALAPVDRAGLHCLSTQKEPAAEPVCGLG